MKLQGNLSHHSNLECDDCEISFDTTYQLNHTCPCCGDDLDETTIVKPLRK